MVTALDNQDLVMQSAQDKYLKIVDHYTKCFEQFGETSKGVDWPNMKDLQKRFKVMFELTNYQTPTGEIKLLDLGCGFGLFLDYLKENLAQKKISYHGIDLSEPMIEAALKRCPDEKFFIRDIIKEPLAEDSYDYIIMNGLFTEKRELSFEEMFGYFKSLIRSAFKSCKIGMAFNVMSHHVDWQRDDLFHLPFDDLANFLTKEFGRNYLIRSDYGLYEYTVYLFKKPNE
jgi:SAM-dependent methyltransferase